MYKLKLVAQMYKLIFKFRCVRMTYNIREHGAFASCFMSIHLFPEVWLVYTYSPSIQRGETEDHTLIGVQSDVCMQSIPARAV